MREWVIFTIRSEFPSEEVDNFDFCPFLSTDIL